MAELNYRVDRLKEPTEEVVKGFLQQLGFSTSTERNGSPDLIIGSKNFTEQYLLAEMMSVVIENYTELDVELKTGLAGTKICFDALVQGAIDLYPEYTGTGLLVILKADDQSRERVIQDPNQVLNYVRQESQQRYDLNWLEPFGFNNTYALMMHREDAEKLDIRSLSDLRVYLAQVQP